jgi:hypothetical protein
MLNCETVQIHCHDGSLLWLTGMLEMSCVIPESKKKIDITDFFFVWEELVIMLIYLSKDFGT